MASLRNGGERQVDRGGRQPALDEMRAVAPQHGPGKALAGGVGRVPGEKTPRAPGGRRGGSGGSPGSRAPGPRAAPARPVPARRPRFPCPAVSRISVWAGAAADGAAGVLLGPQGFGEQLGDPAVDRPQSMQPRVAGAAEGDQGRGGVRGPAVMDDERRRGVTDAAGNGGRAPGPFPCPRRSGCGAAAAVVAGLAEPAAVEIRGSAGAAQRDLYFLAGSHGQRARERSGISPTISDIIIGYYSPQIKPTDGPKETRQNSSGAANSQVPEVHLEAGNASMGLLARGFYGAGRESRLGWYGWGSSPPRRDPP